jgi:hypothetical protein
MPSQTEIDRWRKSHPREPEGPGLSALELAIVYEIVAQFNTLRALHGLSAITKDQAFTAIRDRVNDLTQE